MSKQIKFNYEGTDYTLEYTRRSIEKLEQRGFRLADVADKPVSTLPVLFAGAFLVHHPFASKEVVDRIFNEFADKETLLQKLGEMYNDPIRAMTESEGKVKWEANW